MRIIVKLMIIDYSQQICLSIFIDYRFHRLPTPEITRTHYVRVILGDAIAMMQLPYRTTKQRYRHRGNSLRCFT